MENASGVDVDEVLNMFSSGKGVARRRYLEFVREGIGDGGEGEYYRTLDQRILGSEEFAEEVERQGEKPIKLPTKVPPLGTLAHAVSQASGLRVSDLRGPGATRTQARARRLFVLSAREAGHRNRAVAEYLGRDETMTSKWVRETTTGVMREVSKVLEEVK